MVMSVLNTNKTEKIYKKYTIRIIFANDVRGQTLRGDHGVQLQLGRGHSHARGADGFKKSSLRLRRCS